MSDIGTLHTLSETRREILMLLKNAVYTTTSDIATQLQISDEGARQHLVYMESQGWVRRQTLRPESPRSGRPTVEYEITDKGDALFPKTYDQLSLTLIETVVENYGQEGLQKTLATITDKQVRAWENRLRDKSLKERLQILTNVYLEGDSFLAVQEKDGDLFLVEVNCPIRNIAMKYPQICSTTISTLMRLLGYRIERVQKFQAGDGRCVFKIRQDQPVDPEKFRFELEKKADTTP